jgi:hypothetical protein
VPTEYEVGWVPELVWMVWRKDSYPCQESSQHAPYTLSRHLFIKLYHTNKFKKYKHPPTFIIVSFTYAVAQVKSLNLISTTFVSVPLTLTEK